MDVKLNSDTIEYRIKNPMCIFCENSSIKFFHTWCNKKQSCRDICAKKCPDYKATLEPIERRSH